MPDNVYCRVHQTRIAPKSAQAASDNPYGVGHFAELLQAVQTQGIDWKNLHNEVAVLRAVLLNSIRVTMRAVDAEGATDAIVGQAERITATVGALGSLIERIEKMETKNSERLSIKQVAALSGQLILIINDEVTDSEARQRIADKIEALVIPMA
jgi:hypothetical protein